MATEVVSTIRSSGGDYTSLSAWEAGEQKNLVTADEIAVAECYDDWPSGLSDTVSIAGWTTDATRYVVVRPASGNGHTGTPESGFWVTSSGSVRTLAVSQAYTQIIGIEARQTGTADALQLNATGALAIAVLAKCASTSKSAIAIDNGKAYCCAAWGGGYGFYIANSMQTLNCVAANCSARGFWANASSSTAKNCVAYNNTVNYFGTFSGSSTNNATSSGSDDAPGGSSVTGVSSSDFVDASNNDFHLSSGSALIGAGTNLYSDFQTDIDGDTWPSSGAWDIGFDYRSASGDVTVSLTGSSVTATTGTLGLQNSLSLSGLVGTFSAGTLVHSVSVALGGESATFAAGTVVPSVAIAAIGLQATFSPGTLTPSSSSGDTVALTGEAATFAQTAPSVNVTIALTGIAATMAAGILSASSGTATITVKAGSWLRYKKLQ